MQRSVTRPRTRVLLIGGLGLALIATGALGAMRAPAAASAPLLQAAAQQAAPSLLLKAEPEVGTAGTSFTISGQGLPPGVPVDLVWATYDVDYLMHSNEQTVEFEDRTIVDKRVSLGQTTSDADGRISQTLTAPEDYGDVHDIYAVVDGKNVARGGFKLQREVHIGATEGAVGSDIWIYATGLGWKPYNSTLAVLYDNKYAGFLSSTTTRGSAAGKIRAAGPVGKHTIEVDPASAATPFLNTRQGPQGLYEFRFDFAVTSDGGAPAAAIEWPDASRLRIDPSAIRTTASGLVPAPGFSAAVDPPSGPILSKIVLSGQGLTPGTDVDLRWVTVVGNRVTGGWNIVEKPLSTVSAAEDGSLRAPLQIPDDLGGWHMIKLSHGDQPIAEVPFFVERSLAELSPLRVRAGETFKLQVKGIGWTELDNGLAVTYDNGYLGYACGFNSGGDITLNMVATGGPGTHIIDLYPMIYQGHGKPPWSYQMPQLTFDRDAPGLALGYRLPTFRLAVTVVE